MIAVIPAYEPDEQLVKTAEELESFGFKVLVVNDGSSPDKADIFKRTERFATVLHHEKTAAKAERSKQL